MDWTGIKRSTSINAVPLGGNQTRRLEKEVFPQHPWLDRIQPGTVPRHKLFYRVMKRILDLSVVILTMPVWLLLLLVCSGLILLESPVGSIFFVQKRTGKGGRRFNMFKFRTMVENAEALKAELAAANELAWPDFKIAADPRITRVGHFLRRTSLDELPQILNVIRGEMSLVGPRPTSFSAETYLLWHTERLDVLPGITGLWQVLGRGSTEFDERLRLDIAYIERRCLWLDIQIIFRTLTAVIGGRGAY